MFRPMRRKRQALSEAESRAILERGQTGVLSVAGDNGYPYGVPVNYVTVDRKIVIHGAKTGHKIDIRIRIYSLNHYCQRHQAVFIRLSYIFFSDPALFCLYIYPFLII